jgi:hypothetical protein
MLSHTFWCSPERVSTSLSLSSMLSSPAGTSGCPPFHNLWFDDSGGAKKSCDGI